MVPIRGFYVVLKFGTNQQGNVNTPNENHGRTASWSATIEVLYFSNSLIAGSTSASTPVESWYSWYEQNMDSCRSHHCLDLSNHNDAPSTSALATN
jgi:hypothetical protein